MSPAKDFALVAVGGALGASARYAVARWLAPTQAGAVPWHTLTVNLSGAFLLGLLVALTVDRGGPVGEAWLLFLGIGVLGGFTTFSTFSFETFELLREGFVTQAAVFSLGSLSLGVLAAFAGYALARVF